MAKMHRLTLNKETFYICHLMLLMFSSQPLKMYSNRVKAVWYFQCIHPNYKISLLILLSICSKIFSKNILNQLLCNKISQFLDKLFQKNIYSVNFKQLMKKIKKRRNILRIYWVNFKLWFSKIKTKAIYLKNVLIFKK